MIDKNDTYNPEWMYSDTNIKNMDKMPDQKWHQIISFVKSAVRIIGYGFLPFNLIIAAGILIFSEIIGVIEELV